jgi:transcription antitermination factor NusG
MPNSQESNTTVEDTINSQETSSSEVEEILNEKNTSIFKHVITNCDQLPLFIKKLREFHKQVKVAQVYNKKHIDIGIKVGDEVEFIDGPHIGSTGTVTGINRVRCFVDLGLKNPFYAKISQVKLLSQETPEVDIDSDLEDKFEKEITKEMLDECEQCIDDNDDDMLIQNQDPDNVI